MRCSTTFPVPKCLFALVVVCALGGCQRSVQTYRDGDRAACNAATIVPENAYNRARLAPFAAPCGDREVRVRIAGQRLGGTHNTFSVLPGPQELAVAYVESPPHLNGRQLVTHSVVMTLTAEAGHTYAVRGRSTWAQGQPTVTLWAVDGATGTTVASLVVPRERTKIVGHEHWFEFDNDE